MNKLEFSGPANIPPYRLHAKLAKVESCGRSIPHSWTLFGPERITDPKPKAKYSLINKLEFSGPPNVPDYRPHVKLESKSCGRNIPHTWTLFSPGRIVGGLG